MTVTNSYGHSGVDSVYCRVSYYERLPSWNTIPSAPIVFSNCGNSAVVSTYELFVQFVSNIFTHGRIAGDTNTQGRL